MIKSIKLDYKKRELTVIHDIRIHGKSSKDNGFGEEIDVPSSFDAENEQIITFRTAVDLGIIDIAKLENFIYQR